MRSFANNLLDEWHRLDTEKMLKLLRTFSCYIILDILDIMKNFSVKEAGEFITTIMSDLFGKMHNTIITISPEVARYEKPKKWAQTC